MNDEKHLPNDSEAADAGAADQLLPPVYDELCRLAAARLAVEKPGRTLEATALVHEVYLRLNDGQRFEGRRHFFACAAEAMRRILVEAARRRRAIKRGGGVAEREQVKLDAIASPIGDERLLAVHDALDDLARADPQAALLVKLRFFAGMTTSEAAAILDLSVRSAHDLWAYARAWLRRAMRPG